MATLTTRILQKKKERLIVTLLLTLVIPCSAQTGVLLGLLAGISFKVVIIWILTLFSVLFLVGRLSSYFLPGSISHFIFEIPPLRLPLLSNILNKVYIRTKWYLSEAVPLFIIGTLVLFFIDKIHLLQIIEKIFSPIMTGFLNLPSESTKAFILGFFRRDYGAAGFFVMKQEEILTTQQILISIIMINFFIPCIAQFFVTIKEQGIKITTYIGLFVISFAFLLAGFINYISNLLKLF